EAASTPVSILQGQQHRPAPFAADTDPLDETQDNKQDRSGQANLLIRGHEADEQGTDAHEEQRGDERGLTPHAVAQVAKDQATDRSGNETNREGRERGNEPHEIVPLGEEELREDLGRGNAV